jgi:hypothetical protein
MTQLIPTEFSEQCALVQYLEINNFKFSKIAQETYTKSWKVKMDNKASGLRPGVPDMIVIIPANWRTAKKVKLLFIEMKRTKGGVISPDQKEWLMTLDMVDGITARVCKGFDEAKAFIEEEVRMLSV